MAKNISIDRTKRLREESGKGHNRWHPDIPPVIEVEPGEEVTLETRGAMDLQIGSRMTRHSVRRGISFHVVFWSHAARELREAASKFVELNPYLEHMRLKG